MKWIGKHIFGFDATFRQDVTIDCNLTVAGTSTSFGDDDKIILGAGGDGAEDGLETKKHQIYDMFFRFLRGLGPSLH